MVVYYFSVLFYFKVLLYDWIDIITGHTYKIIFKVVGS